MLKCHVLIDPCQSGFDFNAMLLVGCEMPALIFGIKSGGTGLCEVAKSDRRRSVKETTTGGGSGEANQRHGSKYVVRCP